VMTWEGCGKKLSVTSFDKLLPSIDLERGSNLSNVQGCVMADTNTDRYMFCGPASSCT